MNSETMKFCDVLFRGWDRGDDMDGTDVARALKESGLVLTRQEEDRGDGRQKHYGEGEQPWDAMLRLGWGPVFAAGCVVNYLRRTKTPAQDLTKAKVYFTWLRELAEMDMGVREPPAGKRVEFAFAHHVFRTLIQELDDDEKQRLGIPSCFRLREESDVAKD